MSGVSHRRITHLIRVGDWMSSPSAFTLNDGEVFFDPHPHQAQIMAKLGRRLVLGTGPSKYFLRGNRGGGKSVMMRAFLHGMALAHPGLRYVVVRRNNPDLHSNHLQFLHDEMRKLDGEYVSSPVPLCRYPNGSRGYFRQCEEFRDVEKVVGSEAGILFVDEAPQIEFEYLTLMMPSVRVSKRADGTQPYFPLIVLSGNPTGASIDELDHHFIDKDVEDNEYYDPEDWEHVPINLRDNPSLDPDEYLKSLGPIPAVYRAAWIDGVRMEARTLFDVYKTIDTPLLTKHRGQPRSQPLDPSMLGQPYHYIQELPKIDGVPLLRVPWIQVYRTYDHGYNPDPAVAMWWVVVGRRVFAVHEETWFRTIAEDAATKMVEVHVELFGDIPCAMTYIDPDLSYQDGKDAVLVQDKMEARGVPCEPSINNRVMIADAIHSLLGEEIEPGVPRCQIYEPGCPLLARYLPKMRWDEKNERKMADHKFDHWPMNMGYFGISSGVLTIAQEIEGKKEPIWKTWAAEDARQQRIANGYRRYSRH